MEALIGGLNRLLYFYFQFKIERNICNLVLLVFSLVQQKPGTRIGWTSIIGIRSIMQKFTAVKKQKNLGMWWISRAGWTETGARFHPWQSRQNFSFVGKIIKAKMSGKTECFIRNILTINNHFDFFSSSKCLSRVDRLSNITWGDPALNWRLTRWRRSAACRCCRLCQYFFQKYLNDNWLIQFSYFPKERAPLLFRS